jgi:RND family efflux transporter MFP subunit
MHAGITGRKGLGLVMVMALPLIYLITGCAPETAPQSDHVRPIKTMVVASGAEKQALSFPGKIVASQTAELAFLVSGLIVKFPAREGQRFAKGEMIAQLRQDEFEAQVRIAQSQLGSAQSDLTALRSGERAEQRERLEANVRAAEATLANAEAEYSRHSRLLRSGSISRSVYDRVETAFRVAQEELKSAQQLFEKSMVGRQESIDSKEAEIRGLEARLAESKLQLKDSTIYAPFDGVVARRFVERRQTVMAQTPVVLFQSLEEIDIAVDVPEAIMTTEIRSAEAERTIAEFTGVPGRQFPVKIAEVAQIADPVTQTFNVRFSMNVPPNLNLLPGMTSRVTMFMRTPAVQGQSFLVPVSAVARDSSGEAVVWVIGKNDSVTRKPVKIGEPTGDDINILEGLQPGDRIAISGVSFLRQGMKVRDLGNALGGN